MPTAIDRLLTDTAAYCLGRLQGDPMAQTELTDRAKEGQIPQLVSPIADSVPALELVLVVRRVQ
jgi:hypothetical protein